MLLKGWCMDRRRRAMRNVGVAAIGVVTALSFFLVLSYLFPWSGLNTWREDIDINSGRLSETRVILFVSVRQRVEETWVSKAIDAPLGPADWRTTHVFGPGRRVSPNYRIGSSLAQLREVEKLLVYDSSDFSAREELARCLLEAWQQGSPAAGDPFIEAYSQQVWQQIRG
jgi:hypothetical protein